MRCVKVSTPVLAFHLATGCHGCCLLCGNNGSSATTVFLSTAATPVGCLACVVASAACSPVFVGRDHRCWPPLLWRRLEGYCFDRRKGRGPMGPTQRLHSWRRGGGPSSVACDMAHVSGSSMTSRWSAIFGRGPFTLLKLVVSRVDYAQDLAPAKSYSPRPS